MNAVSRNFRIVEAGLSTGRVFATKQTGKAIYLYVKNDWNCGRIAECPEEIETGGPGCSCFEIDNLTWETNVCPYYANSFNGKNVYDRGTKIQTRRYICCSYPKKFKRENS